MAQLPVKTGFLTLLTLLGTPVSAGAGLNGRFEGAIGAVRLSTNEETGFVSGKSEGGGQCQYPAGQGVLEGEMEGNVFAGMAFLCQVGEGCEDKYYPILAFYDPTDETLSGIVKMDPNCRSPALKNGVFLLQADDTASPPSSATMLARGRSDRKKTGEAHDAFEAATRALRARSPNFHQVRTLALKAVAYDPEFWEAWLLVGVAEAQLGNYDAAIQNYRRSLIKNEDYADTWFNMACAYARLNDRELALQSLQFAVKKGFDAVDALERDEGLAALFGDDPEFRALARDVAQNARRGQRSNRR